MPSLRYFEPEPTPAWGTRRLAEALALPALAAPGEAEAIVLLPSGALICRSGSGVRVNGQRLPGGLRILADRDEIRLGTSRYYFAAREPLAVEVYRDVPAACPRCSGSITPESEVVRCHCGTVFHQSEEHPCFTYGETCPACGGSTQLDEDPWDPSEL